MLPSGLGAIDSTARSLSVANNVLIAGCGTVGSALAARLIARGDRVWGIRREVSRLPAGVTPWQADLSEPDTLGAPPAQFDVLFYTAAAGERSPERYQNIYVDGLSAVIELLIAAEAPIERAFFTSSTAVYGQQDGNWVDETSPTEPASFSGELLLKAEATLAACPWPHTTVRLAGIYGPTRTRLLRQVYDGTARISDAVTNRIHVQDCAGILEHLMRAEQMKAVVIGVDDQPATQREVVTWMAERLGVGKPSGESQGTRTRGANKRCRNARMKALGYELAFPTYREGYAPIVDAFKATNPV